MPRPILKKVLLRKVTLRLPESSTYQNPEYCVKNKKKQSNVTRSVRIFIERFVSS
jgi:hypothetical protein